MMDVSTLKNISVKPRMLYKHSYKQDKWCLCMSGRARNRDHNLVSLLFSSAPWLRLLLAANYWHAARPLSIVGHQFAASNLFVVHGHYFFLSLSA